MDEKILKEIGLTDAEIKVFIELSKVDSAMASEIAEKVGIYRTNIYDIFEALIKKGLVSYIIKANRKHFMASKPQKLLDYLKEREEKIKTIIHELMHIPKCFGGGFRQHKPYVTRRKVEKVFKEYKKSIN